MLDFRDWIRYSGLSFPVPKNQFSTMFVEFVLKDKGQEHIFAGDVGFVGLTIKFFKVRFRTIGISSADPYASKLDHYNMWQIYLN